MEIIYTELALFGNNNKYGRTDTDFLHISEVCYGTVSLLVISSYEKVIQLLLKVINHRYKVEKFGDQFCEQVFLCHSIYCQKITGFNQQNLSSYRP